MTAREFKRVCKTTGCKAEFVVAAPSVEEDRALGLSEPEYCPKHRLLQVRSYSRVACHHLELKLTREGESLVRAVEARKGIGALNSPELLKSTFDPWALPAEGFGPGGLGRFTRPVRVFVENDAFRPIKTKHDFKIAEKGEEILAALEQHQVMVLVGTTGSGKSTYIPWLLLTGGEPGQLSRWARQGPICVTQPRIQATRQVPKFIANQLNGTSLGVGAQIGFSHSGADEYDRRTRLIFKTDGKLINDIVSGAVGNYSIIMIDEAHERSVNIDLILGLLKDQLYLYPHLRVIIASATIDHEAFISFYGGGDRVPFIESKGIQHPVQRHWWGAVEGPGQPINKLGRWWEGVNGGQLPRRQQLPKALGQLVEIVCRHLDGLSGKEKAADDGHILVFLPGSKEIDQTVSIINALRLPNVIAMPLYRDRSLDEQEAALNPQPNAHPHVFGKRRVVVSTNVAETSLTVEGIKHVIDTGYIKESRWSPLHQVQELRTVRHSTAGCRQRWGRAGRMSPGRAYMFYTEEEFAEFPDASTPEVARASLEQVVLTAKAAGVRTRASGRDLDLEWIPLARDEDRRRFRDELERAFDSLTAQKALDADGDLTRFGLELRGMPADLHVGRICTEAERHGMGVEAATLLPFLRLNLGLPSILRWDGAWDTYRKYEVRLGQCHLIFGCRDDLDLFVKLWLLWEGKSESQRAAFALAVGLDAASFEKNICDERRKLLETVKDWRKAEDRPPSLDRLDALRAVIAHCLPNEIYVPLEGKQPGPDSRSRQRFDAPDLLEWQAFWEDGGLYQEYDDDLTFEESHGADADRRSGVFVRANATQGNLTEADRIELPPTSICYGRDDVNMFVACQRRANFNHPVRTKVLGMNNVRLDASWIPDLRGSLVDRCLLYATLSRRRDARAHEQTKLRLFIPDLLPIGSSVVATVSGVGDGHGVPIQIAFSTRLFPSVFGKLPTRTVSGRLPTTQGEMKQSGQRLQVKVLGYEVDADGGVCVLAREHPARERASSKLPPGCRPGALVEVEMLRVLEDPLGRNPMFLVRECETGLEVPMADTDFCGSTVPSGYFGRRFAVGTRFNAQVDAVDGGTHQILLSRGRQLLREYLSILSGKDVSVAKMEVLRVDSAGVYVGRPGGGRDTYVGFVRHALWPGELPKELGSVYEARLRRSERQFSLEEVEAFAKSDRPLPSELNLGIDFDFLLPLAYARFAALQQVGFLVPIQVDRHLDDGGLLVAVSRELTGVIFSNELSLDANGDLRKARSYAEGEELRARIISLQPDKKTVRLSLLRVPVYAESLDAGTVVDVRIVLVRLSYFRNDGTMELTCTLAGQYAVRVATPPAETPWLPGQTIQAKVLRIDRRTNLIDAEYVPA